MIETPYNIIFHIHHLKFSNLVNCPLYRLQLYDKK